MHGLIERGKEVKLSLIRRTKIKEERTPLLKVNNLLEDPVVEINHFEGSGPEWLVHKRTFCF